MCRVLALLSPLLLTGCAVDGGCPSWAGISGVGTTWVYTSDAGVTTTRVVDAIRRREVTISLDVETSGASGEGLEVYRCDREGMWLDREEYSYDSGNSTGSSVTVYDPGGLLLPADLAEGSTWTTDLVGVTTDEHGDTEVSSSYERTAVGTAEIDVPAGSFDTLTVERESGGLVVTEQWADDHGLVQDDAASLDDYRAGR